MKFPLVLAASPSVLNTANSCWSFSFSAINCNETNILTLICTEHKTFWHALWASKKINMVLQTQHAHITSKKHLPIQFLKNADTLVVIVIKEYLKIYISVCIYNYLWFSHIHSKQTRTLLLKNKYNPDLNHIRQAVTLLSCIWKEPSLNTSMNTDETYEISFKFSQSHHASNRTVSQII